MLLKALGQGMLQVHPRSLLSTRSRRQGCWKQRIFSLKERPCYNLFLTAGHFLSSTSGASVKLQSSCCSSQLGHALEQVSSSLSSSLSTISGTPLFSVEPCSGTIPAGQEQLFQMKFSPVYVGDFESRMLCR